jgi:NitT/TauT family transport system ATP-binding protein
MSRHIAADLLPELQFVPNPWQSRASARLRSLRTRRDNAMRYNSSTHCSRIDAQAGRLKRTKVWRNWQLTGFADKDTPCHTGKAAAAAQSPVGNADAEGPLIEFRDIQKSFVAHGRVTRVLDGISLKVNRGEFLAIVGPSGSGKSTVLNLVACHAKPSAGEITYNGRPVTAVNNAVSYLTQDDSLLPWRTVMDNIAIPLEIRRVPARERRERVAEIVRTVGLAGFENHYPRQLSGGMRKRMMLARSLIHDPDTILMDEPFGPLDAQLRLVMQAELLRLWSDSGKTIIFVTHDIVEAVSLADRVIVLSARPSRIKLVEDIALPRPRDIHTVRFTHEFEAHYARLWKSIEVDVMRGAAQ